MSYNLVEIPCPVCGTSEKRIVYHDTLAGAPAEFGYDFTVRHKLTFQIVECPHCTHRYASPRPDDIWQEYQDIADNAYLSHEKDYVATFEKVIKVLKRFLPSGRLLDVGCSAGFFLSVAAHTYDAEGLELSHWAVDLAERKGLRVHKKRLEEFHPRTLYDMITLWGVIEHLENPDAQVKYIRDLLNRGGYVALWTGDVSSLPSRLLGRRWWYYLGQHIQMFTEKSINELFSKNGFEPVYRGTYPYIVSLRSVNRSLARYPWLHKITKPIFCHPRLAHKSLTMKIPGEMFLIFKKADRD
ncbi:MAG: class I SAM-dependent methyltransferase [candidate division NC10 bacterium]|nr:class I SAM-dependent methyltransferase [candidate division NC10 bacterium]